MDTRLRHAAARLAQAPNREASSNTKQDGTTDDGTVISFPNAYIPALKSIQRKKNDAAPTSRQTTSYIKMPPQARRWSYSPSLLLVLPQALSFFQPHAGLTALRGAVARGGVAGGHAATWLTSTSTGPSRSAGFSATTARRRPEQGRRSSAVEALQGKKRKNRREKVSSDSSSWYDEEGDHSADAGAFAQGAEAAAAAAEAALAVAASASTTTGVGAASTMPALPSPNQQAQPEIDRDGRYSSLVQNTEESSSSGSSSNPGGAQTSTTTIAADSSSTTDDALLRPVATADRNSDSIDNDEADDKVVVIEPVWVEGQTIGEKPIVETYGLDALAAEEDGLDIDISSLGGGRAGYDDDANVVVGAGGIGEAAAAGLVDGVQTESWRNGMEVPDDDFVLGEGLKMGRGLDDMLMERSIRFYDPKITGEQEKCYLVGLEASGWGMGRKKGTKGSYPEARPTNEPGQEDGDDGWDDEQEAEYQERKQVAYEARKDEREMRFSLEESMAELSEMAGTAGLEVAGSTYQRVLEPNPRTYIGTGKVKEIKSAMTQLSVCTVIFDDELSPGQQRSLEVEFGGEAAGIKVLDRTALILDIFAQHARTREGQLQVELALLMYRLPRLTKLWTHLERQQGGVGLRGPGERQLEVDRRLLKDKIIALKKELSGVRKHRDFQRRGRRKLGLPVIALVGYTNAGKSTLLNTLTRAGVMAENMLFATLDPTTRKVKLTGLKVHPEVMLTDTVGFIQKLPTNLVAAFRATLEEVVEADVIVHIVDVSSPSREKQENAVTGVLGEMGVMNKPRLTLWNKLDLLPEEEREHYMVAAEERDELTVAASAKTGEGLDSFVTCLEEAICMLLFKVEAVVPYSRGDLLSRVHELGACDVEEYTDAGTLIQARVPTEIVNRLEPYFTPEFRATMEGEERAEVGEEEAAARGVENTWKLIAKKRIKSDAIDEQLVV